MSFERIPTDIPNKQKDIRAKCVHPSGTFSSFPSKAIELSITELFEEQVRINPDRLAVRTGHHKFTYAELNRAANRLAHSIIKHHNNEEGNINGLFSTNPSLNSHIFFPS